MPPISTFVALADPTRCRIVELLRDGPQPVHMLATSFDISRPAISRHLRVLKQAKLISEKKIGRENLYRLHAKRLEPARGWIGLMLSGPKASEPTTAVPPAVPAGVATRRKPVPMSQIGFDF